MEINKQSNEKMICGIWSVDYSPVSKELLLQREPINSVSSEADRAELLRMWYGQQFIFHENGEMVDFYSAPCGNDGQIHQWTGKWQWNEEERLLFLQVESYPETNPFNTVKPSEAYKKGQEFQITEMTEQMMKLKLKNPSERLWEYGGEAHRGKRSKRGLAQGR
jgi:hypothetical protein